MQKWHIFQYLTGPNFDTKVLRAPYATVVVLKSTRMSLKWKNFPNRLIGYLPRLCIGLIQYKKKNWRKSLNFLEKAILRNSSHGLTNFKIGMWFYKKKMWSKAEYYISKAINLNQENSNWQRQYWDVRSKIAIQEEIWPAAEEAISRKLIIYQDPDTYQLLAKVLNKQGKWHHEIKALQSAIALSSQNSSYYFQLGVALEASQCYSEAATAYNKAIEFTKNAVPAHWYYLVGYCLEREINSSSAINLSIINAYQQACAKDRNANQLGIGFFHQVYGNTKQAILAYSDQVKTHPFDADLKYRLGVEFERQSKWVSAEYYYREALALRLNEPLWHFRLGFVLEKQEQWKEASIAYQYAIARKPTHTPYWHYRLANVLIQDNKKKDAIIAHFRIHKILPEHDFIEGTVSQDSSITGSNLEALDKNNPNLNHSIQTMLNYEKKLGNFLHTLIKKEIANDTPIDSQKWFKIGKLLEAGEAGEAWYLLNEAFQEALALSSHPTEELMTGLAYSHFKLDKYDEALLIFKVIDPIRGFKLRIAKECKPILLNLELREKIYKLTFKLDNRSKLNPDIQVEAFILKHRVRVGNEIDEYVLEHQRKGTLLDPIYECEINMGKLNLALHYWDINVELKVFDENYGFILVRSLVPKFSKHIVDRVDKSPLEYIYTDDKFIFYPYQTVGGKKIAFLKRPVSDFDNLIYYQREQKALSEYTSNKAYYDSRNAWMIFEKFSGAAQDNGFYFFKYAVTRRPHVYFVLTENSLDRKHLKEFSDNVIDFMSIEHMILLLSCTLLFSSEGRGHGYAWRRISGEFRNALLSKPFVFLQHGVIGIKNLGTIFAKANKNCAAYKFICSSQQEKSFIMLHLSYNEENMILSGLPRWDSLLDKSVHHKELLLLPSWRNWLEDIDDEAFLQSNYYIQYASLLKSNKLTDILEKFNFQLVFSLHPRLTQHLDKFYVSNTSILLLDREQVTIRDQIERASGLITDYSSIAWDFSYLGKPSIFYQFDIDDYERFQGSYIDLRHDLPGKVFYNEDDLINNIEKLLLNGSSAFRLASPHFPLEQKENKHIPSEIIYSTLLGQSPASK